MADEVVGQLAGMFGDSGRLSEVVERRPVRVAALDGGDEPIECHAVNSRLTP
jgi:hypothetical protein